MAYSTWFSRIAHAKGDKFDFRSVVFTSNPSWTTLRYTKAERALDVGSNTLTKLDSGAEIELCGYCTEFGGLIAAGVKKKELDTAGGKIMLVTSDDPAVVKKIHAMARKVKTEHKKMKEMMEKMQSQKG